MLDQSSCTQLKSLKDSLNVKKKDRNKDLSPNPMLWIADGVDHINIWEQAQTELGKCLAHSSRKDLNHRFFGKFNSMEAFWYYIQSEARDDRIRVMSGMALKTFSKKLTMVRVTNFRAIIMDSNWQCIKQHRNILNMLQESELPFDCYYINKASGIRIRPVFYKWLLSGFEEIRIAVKEQRTPNFDSLLDYRNSEIYEFVLPKAPITKRQADALIEQLEQ